MTRTALIVCVGLCVAACSHDAPQDYHDIAQHRFELRESGTELVLTGMNAAQARGAVRGFAAERPNNGSTFTIAADTGYATLLRTTLINAGISARDVIITSPAIPPIVRRTDRIAVVSGCYDPPSPIMGFAVPDDGYGHSNSNSLLLGCAVRRNIAAMADDPRTLLASNPTGGRDGARGADVYDNWIHGRPTESHEILPLDRTTQSLDNPGGGP